MSVSTSKKNEIFDQQTGVWYVKLKKKNYKYVLPFIK